MGASRTPTGQEATLSPQKRSAATVVAVLTYRRPERLPRLLAALAGQARTVQPHAAVLVVDNDPDGSAAAVTAQWAGLGVRYVHEPRPGISAARNRALAEAAGADVLVFLDDDELPGSGWLALLTGAWRAWGCAAVAGPVSARLEAPATAWTTGSGVFDRRREPTGARLGGAGAGNLLLDLRQVRSLGLRFDERLGLTGGEDTLFTHDLVKRGAELRWCDEAEAVEFVPASRLTRTWILRRSFRAGSSWSRAEVHLAAGLLGRWRMRGTVLLRATVRMSGAVGALTAAEVRRDVVARARAVTTLAAYSGLVVGAFGYVLDEYARTAARPAAAAPPAAGRRSLPEEPHRVLAG